MQTILVAENEAPIRNLVAKILREGGYQVLTASDGSDALNVAGKQRGTIDLLVADIVMPGMGGVELYAWLKAQRPTVKVIFISGYMGREPMGGAFLKKPFTPLELLGKVREVLPPEQG